MKKRIFVIIPLLLCTACDSPFDVHPYDVHIKGEHGINAKNIERIEQQTAGRDTLRIAMISDTHGWYADAKAEVRDVNSQSVDFVIHLGDLTDTGTTKEYEWVRDMLGSLTVPYVALIGNHDFLGTGD